MLKKLRQDRHDLKTEGNAIFDAADKEGRELSEAEEKRVDEIEVSITDLDEKIATAERRAEQRRSMQPDAGGHGAQHGGQAADFGDVRRVSVGEDRSQQDPRGGWASMAEMASAVMAACQPGAARHVDQRLMAQPSDPHVERGADEGYLVPTEFRNEIWRLMFEDGSLLSRFNFTPTNRSSVKKPRNTDTPWSGTGVTAYWGAEASQLTESSVNIKANTVDLHKLHAFVTASDELLSDAPMLNSLLGEKAAEAIQWKMVDAVVNGDGVGKPLGWMNSGALVSAAELSPGGSVQGADTIIAENVADMYARMLPSSIGRAFWLINPDALSQLLTMTLGDNTVYTLPNEGFRGAPGGFLLGRPVVFHETAQTVGDKGDIQFIDPEGYFGIRKAGSQMGMKFATSIHLFFNYDVQAFRWTVRIGGEPYLDAAITPPNSTVTKSHFVALAARDGS